MRLALASYGNLVLLLEFGIGFRGHVGPALATLRIVVDYFAGANSCSVFFTEPWQFELTVDLSIGLAASFCFPGSVGWGRRTRTRMVPPVTLPLSFAFLISAFLSPKHRAVTPWPFIGLAAPFSATSAAPEGTATGGVFSPAKPFDGWSSGLFGPGCGRTSVIGMLEKGFLRIANGGVLHKAFVAIDTFPLDVKEIAFEFAKLLFRSVGDAGSTGVHFTATLAVFGNAALLSASLSTALASSLLCRESLLLLRRTSESIPRMPAAEDGVVSPRLGLVGLQLRLLVAFRKVL